MIQPVYIIDKPQGKHHKNKRPKTLQPSVEPVSNILGMTQNIVKDPPTTSFHQSPDLEDQIPQLTQGTLNLIGRAVNVAATQAMDQRLVGGKGPSEYENRIGVRKAKRAMEDKGRWKCQSHSSSGR